VAVVVKLLMEQFTFYSTLFTTFVYLENRPEPLLTTAKRPTTSSHFQLFPLNDPNTQVDCDFEVKQEEPFFWPDLV